MRYLTTAMVAVALASGTSAWAGDYHKGASLKCNECHTMHYSQQHQFDGTAGQGTPALAGGPNGYLLRQPEAQLCQACHDGTAIAPDVVGENVNGYARQGGALNVLGGSGDYAEWKGHTIGYTGPIPGSTTAITLGCLSCHHQHGAASGGKDGNNASVASAYRNVRTLGGKSISYQAGGTNDGTKDIFEADAALGQLNTHYAITNVQFNEPNASASGYANWCAGCHTDFHGTANTGAGPEGFTRHPTAGVNLGALGGGHSATSSYTPKANKVHALVPGAQRLSDPTGATWTDITPSCMSCHKAHGNKNPFGLIYMSGTGTLTDEGDSNGTRFEWTCKQCHKQGPSS